jgi:hypothetical protein
MGQFSCPVIPSPSCPCLAAGRGRKGGRNPDIKFAGACSHSEYRGKKLNQNEKAKSKVYFHNAYKFFFAGKLTYFFLSYDLRTRGNEERMNANNVHPSEVMSHEKSQGICF